MSDRGGEGRKHGSRRTSHKIETGVFATFGGMRLLATRFSFQECSVYERPCQPCPWSPSFIFYKLTYSEYASADSSRSLQHTQGSLSLSPQEKYGVFFCGLNAHYRYKQALAPTTGPQPAVARGWCYGDVTPTISGSCVSGVSIPQGQRTCNRLFTRTVNPAPAGPL